MIYHLALILQIYFCDWPLSSIRLAIKQQSKELIIKRNKQLILQYTESKVKFLKGFDGVKTHWLGCMYLLGYLWQCSILASSLPFGMKIWFHNNFRPDLNAKTTFQVKLDWTEFSNEKSNGQKTLFHLT